MSIHGGATSAGEAAHRAPERPHARRRMVGSVVRISTVTPAIFVVYALAPLDGVPGVDGALLFLASLLLFGCLVGYQVLAVVRSPFPWLRALEAATMCVPVLVVLFSIAYFVTSRADPAAFNESLTRVDAVYFTTSVFATVGFGDVVPASEATRTVVSIQMALDLVVVGLLARVLFKAAERRHGAISATGDRFPG